MARHIMAVCVVCLLCADRLPCQQHLIENFFSPAADSRQASPQLEYQQLNAKVFHRTDLPSNPSISESTDTNSRHSNYAGSTPSGRQQHAHQRRKRHAGHVDEAATAETVLNRPEITEEFLKRIFDMYGQEDGTISITQFQHMLRLLGLHQLVERKLTNERTDNDTCIDDSTLVHHVQPHDLSHHEHQHHRPHSEHAATVNCSTEAGTSCAHAQAHNDISGNYTLNEKDVLNLCPVLLYQLTSPLQVQRNGCIESAVLAEIDSFEAKKFNADKDDIVFVWIYAFISVFACGILGLVGVAIIPFMDSRYYKHIIQFLVSLAVGTMTGDALLHLLPHALAGQSEKNMIFKGLTCMGGIVFFYITEHGLTMISEWRKRIAKRETKKPSRAKVMRDVDSSINNSVAGDKLCKSKYSSYPYCYDEIAMDTKNDVWLHLPNNTAETHDVGNDRKRNGKAEGDAGEMAAQSLLSTSHNNYAPIAELNHQSHQLQQNMPDSNTISTDLDGNSMGDGVNVLSTAAALNGNGSGKEKEKEKPAAISDTVTVILREHESSHHGHSHKHGHVHSPPESLSAVAWMIIMGDGLHNFTDGMAIGAAFAENIAGGFSTSLAVFCHELPHELGDFAILIKAGMSVKSAVYYNLLTGVLSFIGMIVGIVFGQSPETAQWMFAAAAGLFIYIALVDMMPELSAAHKSVEQFALQVLGMCSGVLLMLLIAVYEGDLMNAFSVEKQYVH